MINPGLFSSATDMWETPHDFFDTVRQRFGPTLDVCATSQNAKCEAFFTEEEDGLSQHWHGICWMNPPYGREISKWIRKAYMESSHCTVVALLPARTDTKWFHDYIYEKDGVKVEFIRGRLKFGGSKNSAPFPSMLVIFSRGEK